MQRLNPLDALNPAFQRTYEILLSPFRLWSSWKLAACAGLAVMGSIFLPVPLLFLVLPAVLPHAVPRIVSTGLAIGATLYTVVCLALFYLGVRLQLVQLEMVLTRARTVGPMWKRQGPRVWAWLWLKVGAGLVLTLIVAPALLASIRVLFQAVRTFSPQQKMSPEQLSSFMTIFYGFYAAILCVYLVFLLVATLLDDFVLPFYELEGLSVGAALARGWQVLVAEPLQMVLYLLVKGVFAFIGYIAVSVISQLCLLPFIFVGFVAAVGFGLTSHGMQPGGGTLVLLIAGVAVLVLAVLAVMIFVQLGLMGYLMLLLRSFALYFLGGRYEMLGDVLSPMVSRPFTPPPPPPSKDEQDDDDGGPPLPMNPALA
jgi:hypothetical protein